MITIQDFNSYVESFGKKPGEYTPDDQIQIGVKFKQLPLKLRNWNTLVSKLGLNCSGNAIRKRVEKFLKKNPELFDNKVQGEVYLNDYIEQQKVRDWYNAYRRDIREEARIQNLKEEIERAANKFSPLMPNNLITPVYKEDKVDEEAEAVLLLSDLHIGAECSNYYNSYNSNIALLRLNKLADNVIKYCLKNNVTTLHVLNLGDMIHGLIHTNARIEQQMDVAEQIMFAGELISQFMLKLIQAAPYVTYRSVFDNHSRAVSDKNQHIEKEQFSRVIDWFVKERLKYTEIDFIENNIDGGVGNFRLKNGKNVIFAHGHQDNINSSWQNFIGMTKEWVDYILLAHYHNPKEKSYNGSMVFVNGSILGVDSYSFGRRLFSDPSQKLLIFNKTNTYQDITINLKVQ